MTSLRQFALFCVISVVLASCDRSTRPATSEVAPTPGPDETSSGPSAATLEQTGQMASAEAARVASVAVETIVPPGARIIPCAEADGMSCVPGGWFIRGVESDEHACEQPGQPRGPEPSTTPVERVWVSTFMMDETEVTNAAYQACVERGDCPKAGPRYVDFDGDDQPVTGVSWFDAKAFCEAHGKRLPTEAEFEKAARGPDGSKTPFGDDLVDCKVAVIKDVRGRSCGVRRDGRTPLTGRVMPVRSRPAGRYGLYHMVGNAEEWVADWFSRDWEACGDACRGVDPKGPCDGADACDGHRNRVVRGGSWYWPAEHATGYHRRPHIPSNELFHHFGFRCARTVTPEGGALE